APDWHINMQAAFQKHCDSSISKTINFAHDASPVDVDKIYRMAYELDCKGVTVYRDGCRASQPMALAGSEKKHNEMTKTNGNGHTEASTISVDEFQSRAPEEAVPAIPVGSDRLIEPVDSK